MKKCDWILLVALVLGLSASMVSKYKVGDYYTDLYWDCNVSHKLQTSAGYKVSAKFILVLKLDDGRIFDLDVSPSCWANADIGEKLTFKISEHDIQFIPAKQHWDILVVLLYIFSLFMLLVWVIFRFFYDEN